MINKLALLLLLLILPGRSLFAVGTWMDAEYAYSFSNNFAKQQWTFLKPALNGENARREIVELKGSASGYATKHTIRYGQNTFRAESMHEVKFPNDSIEIVTIKIFLEKDYQFDDSPEILCQWHGTRDFRQGELMARSPPLALGTQSGNWVIRYVWDRNFISKPTTLQSKQITLGPYQKDLGKFTEWSFQINWNFDEAGALKAWRNGKLVVDLDKISIGYNDARGTYFKFGIYKWDWKTKHTATSERTVYHTDFFRAVIDTNQSDHYAN